MAKVKTSRKFATLPVVLVANGKNVVANVTVLVAIPSPVPVILGHSDKCDVTTLRKLQSFPSVFLLGTCTFPINPGILGISENGLV